MDGNRGGVCDGEGLHRRVAARLGGGPKRVDWREARDLALVLALSTSAPLATLALELGAYPVLALGLTALTVGCAGLVARVLRQDYALDLWSVGPIDLPLQPTGARSSWRTLAFRLVPARHHQPSATEVRARAGAVTGLPRRAPGRPSRPRPGS